MPLRLGLVDRSSSVALSAGFVACYLAVDALTQVRPQFALGITPWNPQSGLLLWLLLVRGWRGLPVVAIAALAGELFVRRAPVDASATWLGAGWVALTLAVMAGVLRRDGMVDLPDTSRRATGFAGMALLGTAVLAAGYVSIHALLGTLPRVDVASAATRYWVANCNGALVVTPLLLCISSRTNERRLPLASRDLLGRLLVVLFVLAAVFLLPAAEQLRFFYLLFLPIVWIASRWRWQGGLLAVFLIQAGLVVVAEARIPTARFIDLQFLLLALTLTAMLLGAVVSERMAAFRQVEEREAERLRAETKLRERDAALAGAMRLAVAGELASALTHELNQPITALVSYLQACEILASADRRDDVRLQATLSKSVDEAIRASQVLHRLRDFYRSGESRLERVDLDRLCSGVADSITERLRRGDVTLALAVEPDLPVIQADGLQLEIVLHNLLANAFDAVALQTAEDRRIALTVFRDGDAICLRVDDSGPGVAPELRDRLFDPFVTEKPQGMGLGLAISQTLVRARGGDLVFEPSARLGGAAFTVRLPLRYGDAANE